MKKILIKSIIYIIFISIFIYSTCIKSYAQDTVESNSITVGYKLHVQNIGWQNEKYNGETAGTTGKSLRAEAIKITTKNLPQNVKIKYSTHVQNIGWQNWKYDGEIAGTEGKSLRLEAIKIQLENTTEYSIMYRVHIQDIGWQSWKYDGEIAGTEGRSLRVEAIEIKIVKKVERAKLLVNNLENTYYDNETINIEGWKLASVSNTELKAYVDNKEINLENKITYSKNDNLIEKNPEYGINNENPMPVFKIKLNSNDFEQGKHTLKIVVITKEGKELQSVEKTFNIEKEIVAKYTAHIQNIGWQDWKENGETAGTEGKSLRMEAIKIQIKNMPDGVKIKYKAHVQDVGWQDWNDDGEIAGTEGKNLRMEAIKIKIENTDEYSIMYRVHVQDVGWQEWCFDGEASGTVGGGKRIEAIEIKIVKKINEEKVKICIDSPTEKVAKGHISKISGWIMKNVKISNLKIKIDDKYIDTSYLRWTKRQDVLNEIKGYGDEELYNNNPGFYLNYDFSNLNIGNHSITISAVTQNETIISESETFYLRENITTEVGTYGFSGLKVAGDSRGTDLKYYRFGDGPNVFFATFAIHGWEDLWNGDGQELTKIAEGFYNKLIEDWDVNLAKKWTIYILPALNPDGESYGWTNNGPGRNTLYSAAIYNIGVDMNRCWSTGFKEETSSRNFTGSEPFLAYESRYLRDFLLSKKSSSGQTVLVDLHGWLNETIGDNEIGSYYRSGYGMSKHISTYGKGYLVNWARSNLGTNGKVARSCLVELPEYNSNANTYINSTLNMLNSIL